MSAPRKAARLALLCLVGFLAAPAHAQDFDMFAGKRDKRASAPLSFETATLKGGRLVQELSPDKQAMMRFRNDDPHAVYRVSVTTDKPGPIALRVLQLELDGSSRATKQTPITGGNVNTGEATSLALPPMLLPTGDIYIGLGTYYPMGATLTIESDAGRLAKPAKAKSALKVGGDWLQKTSKTKQCWSAPRGRAAHDVRVTALPGTELIVTAEGKARSPAEQKIVESYSVQGSATLVGLDGSAYERLCIRSQRDPSPVRVQISAGEAAQEPDYGRPLAQLATLKPGQALTRNWFPGDTDVVRIPPAPRGKAHWVDVSGVVSAKACFQPPQEPSHEAECVGDVRRIGPLLGGDDVLLRLSDFVDLGATRGGTYTLRSELLPFDAKVDRSEPNWGDLATQVPPAPNARTGLIRFKGSHLSKDDQDTYHWAELESEQLWRIRAVGPGLTGGTISLNGKRVVNLSPAPGTTGRLSADDVYLGRGKAFLSLRGNPGEYSVIIKPIGAPPPGFELEGGVENEGQLVRLGETVTGILRTGDRDTLVVPLQKAADVSLRLEPPLGAQTFVWVASDELRRTVKPGDGPIALTLPPGRNAIELTPEVGSPMDYELTLSRRNAFDVVGAPLSLTPPKVPDIRAWSDNVQELEITVTIRNTSSRAISGTLTAKTPNHLMLVGDVDVSIPARGSKTAKLLLRLLPDIAPDSYLIMAGVKDGSGKALGGVTIALTADIDASDTGAQSQPALPKRLMGAMDLAHRNHGANWTAVDAGARSFVNKSSLDNLLDWLWVYEQNRQAELRFDRAKNDGRFTLDLGRDAPVPLVGVGFALVGAYPTPMGAVEIETSTDGKTFRPWISGVNDQVDATQFMEGETRAATHMRLVLPKSSDEPRWSRLSELYVFAEPGRSGLPSLDLLRHGYGAKRHLNDDSPRKQSEFKRRLDGRANVEKVKGTQTYRVTGDPISFRNVMRADVVSAGLGWEDGTRAAREAPDRVIVMGTDALNGTWRELVSADVPDPAKTPQFRFDFPEAETVRFIRFDYESSQKFISIPAELYAYERPESDDYLSVIGEWTERPIRSLGDDAPVREGGKLALDAAPARGVVQYGADTDRWTVQPTGDANVLLLDVEGGPGFDPKVSAKQNGKTLTALAVEPQTGTMVTRHSFRITPGKTVEIEVAEDKRSVLVLANPGGDLLAFRANVLNGLVAMSRDMVAGRDAVAFSPMSAKTRTPWITDPDKVTRPVLDMFEGRRGGDNDSKALAASARFMAGRSGSKAIILIGDGKSSNGDPGLETALEDARARLFIAKPPGSVVDLTYAPTNDVMQGWTQIAGGDVSFDTTQAGYERMFSRASAKMRGPKLYRIAARVETQVFAPGQLVVRAAPPIAKADKPERTQMVLLDTSGSMLKRIGDTRRFAIAREALSDYVAAQSKSDDKFDRIGLRLFGGPPQSCETSLALAPSPLDGRFGRAVSKVVPKNNAKTPIAAALKAAGNDLKGVDGEVNILLLTDGEETCDGDPLAEVEALQKAAIDVRLDVVSFALADDVSRTEFESWARAGGGRYVDAQSSTELADALADSRARGFQVFAGETVVAAGQVGADALDLPAGQFELVFEGSDTRHPVTVRSGKTTEFTP